VKYLILLILSINSAIACNLSIPESYIPTFLNPPVIGAYETCESKPNETCHCVDNINSWYSSFVPEIINGSPIYGEKQNISPCVDEESCELLRPFLCQEIKDSYFFYATKSNNGYEAYCTLITGYEQIPSGNKILVTDETKLQAYNAKIAAEKAFEEGISQVKKLRECGGRVMDVLLVRNAVKGLTTEQVKTLHSTYSNIQSYLLSGSLHTAKEEIIAAEVNPPTITQSDKDALVSEINKCLGI
jgi:hypothetical protein